jgi:hypothetical protein
MFAESTDEARKLYEEILNGLTKLRGEELGVEGRLKNMNDVQAAGACTTSPLPDGFFPCCSFDLQPVLVKRPIKCNQSIRPSAFLSCPSIPSRKGSRIYSMSRIFLSLTI